MTDFPNTSYLPEQTVHYKTYLKQALVEAMRAVFENHPDQILRDHTQVSVDLPTERAAYPAIVIRYYGRNLRNMGVGHIEHIQNPNGQWQPYKHFMYSGDVEFAIYALSSVDRDILADSVAQILSMGDLEYYSNLFGERIYSSDDPNSIFQFININSDEISEFGETQAVAPWMPEDTLVYQTSLRVGLMGEFYSRPLETEYGLVEQVEVYPYFGADQGGPEDVPTGDPNDKSEWEPLIVLKPPVDNG